MTNAGNNSPRRVFVFGSNLAGIHGAGSAKHAHMHHGAIWGRGWGFAGDSFAIPTKDKQLQVLSLDIVQMYVESFVTVARAMPDVEFDVVAIGCGLAEFTPEQIAPFFRDLREMKNVHLPKEFLDVLDKEDSQNA